MSGSNESPPARGTGSGSHSHWQQYLDLLDRKGVPPAARRWYVARVEAFLHKMGGTPLRSLTSEAVTDFFDKVARKDQLADWQFRQLVDAVQLLLVDLADTPAGRQVDWGTGARVPESARELEPAHPTLAREGPPPQGPAPGRCLDSAGVLARMARALRAKQYSIRTEQSYVDWCRRFLGFCGPRPPEQLGGADV